MKAPVILLVSNDPEVIAPVEEAVFAERHGFRHIADRDVALREMAEGCDDIDVAILDLDPGIRGWDLLNAAREQKPVLVVTHRTAEDMERILRRHGARGYLTKPITAERIRTAVHELLASQVAAA